MSSRLLAAAAALAVSVAAFPTCAETMFVRPSRKITIASDMDEF